MLCKKNVLKLKSHLSTRHILARQYKQNLSRASANYVHLRLADHCQKIDWHIWRQLGLSSDVTGGAVAINSKTELFSGVLMNSLSVCVRRCASNIYYDARARLHHHLLYIHLLLNGYSRHALIIADVY